MKQFIRSLLSIALLVSTAGLLADCGGSSCNNSGCSSASCSSSCESNCDTCHSIFVPRSVGANVVREFNPFNYPYDIECFGGTASLAFEWQRSFRGDRLARCLFGGNECLSFVGSEALTTGTRPSNALIADNFGISPFASGALSFRPRIEHFILDFQFQFNFDNWCNGAFFRINAPFDYTRWSLRPSCATSCAPNSFNGCSNACSSNGCSTGCSTGCSLSGCSTGCSTGCSNTCSTGCSNSCDNLLSCSLLTTPFPAGCVAPISSGAITPAASIQEALSGDFTFGAMSTPWKYGRFNFCTQHTPRLADLDMILGWNFWNCEDYHVGIGVQVVAPTGTKIDACHARNFFKPISGNGHHWEVGAFFSAHAELWNCDEQSITMYIEGNVTHMFRSCQVRSFDFLNRGCMSRYMLLSEFSRSTAGVFTPTGNLINAINYNTRFADVKVNVKGDAMIEFLYRNCGWMVGLGYNIYGNSREDICIKDGFVDSSLNGRFFGIRGCSPVAAAAAVTGVGGSTITAAATGAAGSTPILVNATMSNATSTSCGTVDNGVALTTGVLSGTFVSAVYANPCAAGLTAGGTPVIGTPLASVSPVVVSSTTTPVIAATGTTVTLSGLTPAPVILAGTADELDPNSARTPHQLSNKVFASVGYAWTDNCWVPYVDVIGEAEFARRHNCCVVNQGGIILKAGLQF